MIPTPPTPPPETNIHVCFPSKWQLQCSSTHKVTKWGENMLQLWHRQQRLCCTLGTASCPSACNVKSDRNSSHIISTASQCFCFLVTEGWSFGRHCSKLLWKETTVFIVVQFCRATQVLGTFPPLTESKLNFLLISLHELTWNVFSLFSLSFIRHTSACNKPSHFKISGESNVYCKIISPKGPCSIRISQNFQEQFLVKPQVGRPFKLKCNIRAATSGMFRKQLNEANVQPPLCRAEQSAKQEAESRLSADSTKWYPNPWSMLCKANMWQGHNSSALSGYIPWQ
jgi:hypothetical protein